MRSADVFVDGIHAGVLQELEASRRYRFIYDDDYKGGPVSLTMPTQTQIYDFDSFPPFFDGVLPEGVMLDSLLRQAKIDRDDAFSQLILVGEDLVGNVQVRGRE